MHVHVLQWAVLQFMMPLGLPYLIKLGKEKNFLKVTFYGNATVSEQYWYYYDYSSLLRRKYCSCLQDKKKKKFTT